MSVETPIIERSFRAEGGSFSVDVRKDGSVTLMFQPRDARCVQIQLSRVSAAEFGQFLMDWTKPRQSSGGQP